MPLITDSERSLDALIGAAATVGAAYFGGGVLFLQPCAQKVFFPFLDEQFPRLARRYRERYEGRPYLHGPVEEAIKERVRRLRAKHGLASSPVGYQPELAYEPEQISLF